MNLGQQLTGKETISLLNNSCYSCFCAIKIFPKIDLADLFFPKMNSVKSLLQTSRV